MKTVFKLLALVIILTIQLPKVQSQVIDLSGSWGFQLDPTDFERAFENSGAHKDLLNDKVILPGTTDANKKGYLTTNKPINRLSRYYEYVGPAWYQKDIVIPMEWEGKFIELFFERILWISSLYVDGRLLATEQSFSTPHVYNLSKVLKPGKHRISVCVDNRVGNEFDRWSHAFTEYTQTCWNGIVGKMELRAFDQVNIKNIQVYPDVSKKTAKVVCTITNLSGRDVSGTINLSASTTNSSKTHQVKESVVQFSGSGSEIKTETELEMGNDVQLWDEFSPILYNLKASLLAKADTVNASDVKNIIFGMRNISSEGAHFTLNNRKIFLRGTLECGIFPSTGYPDITVEGWLKICKTVKEYGLNHIRFHSWCPPEEAFIAADQTGIMFQVELPFWSEATKATDPLSIFLHKEMERILDNYGNHASFVLLCMGNELRGNFDIMADLVKFGKEKDPRHLYSGSTARKQLSEDQFYVSHQSKGGRMTTYGACGPQTDYDLRKAYDVLMVPGVAHEVGQRAVYPNFDEIKKYMGLLYPRNFELFRDTLIKHGMIDQAKDFFSVSGNMTVFLYKESIEALLRTPNCGGFQLLDLHDFPGQGTALVGILDPFWDSKGFVTAEKFREFCNPTVPILRLTKREYFNTETFTASAELYHYGDQPLTNMELIWDIKTSDNKTIASGIFKKQNIQVSTLTILGDIKASLSKIVSPKKLKVTIHVGKAIKNEWDIWVYPKTPKVEEKNFTIARTMDESTIVALKNGKNVLMLPDVNQLVGKNGSFQNHFWNPIMFRSEPMSMGTLVKNQHPAFKYFPTEFYTNWQWWNIISNAVTINLEGTPVSYRPLLQTIDTYDRCLKQGIIFEAQVENGKLFMVCIDFEKDIANRPATQQLLYSIKQYISGADFNPAQSLPVDFFMKMFKKP
jgi:Glycosyl hydrolases family 2, sugar binding domain/Glycosyl hydrolases family 2